MPKLLFFSRVALLCNLSFVVAFLMHYSPKVSNGFVPSTIIILGFVLSIVINILINMLYILITLADKPISHFVPQWLIITNFLFFLFQAILLIK